MAKLVISGHSDDIVMVTGDFGEEFYPGKHDNFLAVSDGTLIKVNYDSEGIWRFHILVRGAAADIQKLDGIDGGKDELGGECNDGTDVILIEGEQVVWVAMAIAYDRVNPKRLEQLKAVTQA